MEIRIDTEKDSNEQIKKAISFLQSIIGERQEAVASPNTHEDNGFFGMFNETNSAPDNSQGETPMLNLFDDSNGSSDTSSFSIDEELSKNDDSKEETKEDAEDLSVIPY